MVLLLQRIKMTNSFYYWRRKGSRTSTKTGTAYSTKKEIKDWVLPDNNEAAVEEAEHLIERSDSDKDGKLSIEEIVNNHEDFVGSQATNYGEFLPKDEL